MTLWAALFGRAWAAELNEDDAGDCVPLNKEQQPWFSDDLQAITN